MRIVVSALVALTMAGCATASWTPVPRLLTQEQRSDLGPTMVAVVPNRHGIEMTWTNWNYATVNSSLVTAAMSGAINSGPGAEANRIADELEAAMTSEDLNASLVQSLRRQVASEPASGSVTIQDVVEIEAFGLENSPNDTITILAQYGLSADATMLQAFFQVAYSNDAMPYVSRYTDPRIPARWDTGGPVYRSHFGYVSKRVVLPTGSEQLSDSDRRKAVVALWSKDSGRLLRTEIETMHDFVARYLVQDLNYSVLPTSSDGVGVVLETLPDGRVIVRDGGFNPGVYSSHQLPKDIAVVGPSRMTSTRNQSRLRALGQPTQR